jgi:hypothetical protein
LYFPRIVDTLSLSNGLYTYHLSARGKTGKIYDAEKTLFVVSDSSVANAVSDSTGRYYFDGKDAFIGDSVTVMFGQNPGYGRLLDGSVMLLIIKDGYESQRISVDLLQGTILARDIVLRKIR